jgi:aminomethyltransferase
MEETHTDVSDQYHVIRENCGLVDYAGAGVFQVTGSDATEFLSRICSRNMDFLLEGQILPALLITDDGYLAAEVLVHCESRGFRVEAWPDSAAVVRERLTSAAADEPGVTVDDLSAATRVLALEGPRSPAIAQTMLSFRISSMAYPSFVAEMWEGVPLLISRTGVSGEYGFKFHVSSRSADLLADKLQAQGAVPVGRAALDICRMEMRFANLEREVGDRQETPFSVGLQWMVDFGHDFRGKEALLRNRAASTQESLVCWRANGEIEVPEPGTPLLASGTPIGRVRYALFSPGLDRVIGVADLEADIAVSGLTLALGADEAPVHTVSSPFVVATSLGVKIE